MRPTAAELQSNFDRPGLSLAEAAADLTMNEAHLTALLGMRVVGPAEVWLVPDYFEQAVRDVGKEPVPFSILT
ncbi:hypothetical protein BLIN9172_01263 [Brevibacterium linens ATCC 9172]|uniref:Transcriptional regulator n=2 Tax=Brevibacterium linens TaxID=1703 RepID=A0A2H1IMU7_BRELN|nr:hypothetical protein BLIN9172_01263 [Brevibacterium linens ATCC 9172]